MCSGIFSCMDDKKTISQMTLTAMEDLLQQESPDERCLSHMLSLTDRLYTIVAEGNRNRAGNPRHHTELYHAADALYQETCNLFDDPTSQKLWQSVADKQLRCRQLFELEMEAFRASCG